MTAALRLLLTALLGFGLAVHARATECDAAHAGYRVLDMPSGRKLAVWYPTEAAEQPTTYGRASRALEGSVARDAPPAACTRVPLVLFSHGLGGCALQSLFITEALARHGYVVAAPDHRDAATCGIEGEGLRLGNLRTDHAVTDPRSWTDQSEIGRLQDLRAVIERVRADAMLAKLTDAEHIGAIGHSLGGYSVLGLAGAWPTWRTAEVTAVVALSPYLTPFLAQGALQKLAVPVMYQGAQYDLGVTPAMEGAQGAFALSPAPKYFVKLKGGTHLEWTNIACLGHSSVTRCVEARPNLGLIDAYAIGFFDRYLKGKAVPLLDTDGSGLLEYRVGLR
jgi:predicted dienelactone hydrolase